PWDPPREPGGGCQAVRDDMKDMADTTDTSSVTADRPDSPIQTTGTDHITIWGSNETDTIAFYRDLLGMPLVLKQPNLDDPSQTHLFFDTGDGRILTVFVGDRQSTQQPQRGGVGAVHHLCFSVAPSDFEDVIAALEADGRGYNVFDRGVFFSLYTQDNNGLIIELSTDKYDIPSDRRGEVLAKAQELRVADDADYAKDKHLAAALEALDLDAHAYDLPEATSGVGSIN
ncbi:MAG: lactoylglutathione lyase, partial [Haloquadratum walsbyi J07HQW1]